MQRYTTAQREKAIKLHKKGFPTSEIGKIVGVPRTTVNGWIDRSEKLSARLKLRRVDPRAVQDATCRVEKTREDEERYAHFYNDPNVALLGDPPLHRSALGQKLRAEGRL